MILWGVLGSSFGSGIAFAEIKEKPVSVSYINVVNCYPELKNEALSLKVDLSILND
jgi:hypothetical protein